MSFTKSILILFIGLTLGFGIGNRVTRVSGKITLESNPKKEKLNRLIDYIEDLYVNPVDTDSIVDKAVSNILGKLDPHSTYIPKEDMSNIAERMQGDFIGIGVNYFMKNDTIAVISTIAGGPSSKAGILSGDRILMVGSDTLHGKKAKNKGLIKKLKGPIDSNVQLLVERPDKGLINFDLKRAVVPIKSVGAVFMLSEEIGYIKIERFAETTYKEFKESLNFLLEKNIKGLVLDLRGNGGGYVSPAIEIADEFLEDDKLIMFTKDRNNEVNNSIATSKGDFEKGQVYVLIDENSASASEILAGALQDNDKGVIIGRRSFGKGLVQREMDLGDGSSVRLTVSKYFTPTGRSIQRSYEKGKDAYYEEYLERYNSGELQDSTKVKVNDSLIFKTPKGKIVYGGGGIIPEVYVEKSSDRNVEVLEFADYSGVLSRFVFNELDKNRNFYNALSNDKVEEFVVTEEMLTQFKKYSGEKGLDFSETKESNDKLIKLYLRAEIAKQLISTNLYYKIINSSDSMIKKVLSF